MFLVRITRENGTHESKLYFDYESYHRDTWTPGFIVDWFIDFTIHGKTYPERKADAVNLAIEFQNFATEVCDLSYSELYHIGTALEKAAKRYGLVKEFRENGII